MAYQKRVIGFEPSTFTIGNVTARSVLTPPNQGLTTAKAQARSKYAERTKVRIKRVISYSAGEWPQDPDHALAV